MKLRHEQVQTVTCYSKSHVEGKGERHRVLSAILKKTMRAATPGEHFYLPLMAFIPLYLKSGIH